MGPPGGKVDERAQLLVTGPTVVEEGEADGYYGTRVARVGIIGGGIAGLNTCRSLKARGVEDIKIFEAQGDIGGVWRAGYDGFGLQVAKQLYTFPDFPFEAVRWNKLASGQETREYIKQFAQTFHLLEHVTLNARVTETERVMNGWRITYVQQEETHFYECDFLVLATGMHSRANLPEAVRMAESYEGVAMHSSEFVDKNVATGKRVLVVGMAKSAKDCAVSASEVAAETTLVFRRAHWSIPQYLFGFLQLHYVFYSRFGSALMTLFVGPWPVLKKPPESRISRYARLALYPFFWCLFKAIELVFAVQRDAFGVFKPQDSLVPDLHAYGHATDTDFRDLVRSGKIQTRVGDLASLGPGRKVTLRDGTSVDADVVVCGTGYASNAFEILPKDVIQSLDPQRDGIYLYHQCFPATIRSLKLAFVGAQCTTSSNTTTSALQAELLARVLAGAAKLPSPDAMARNVDQIMRWKRSWMLDTSTRAAFAFGHLNTLHDAMLLDMGENPYRKRTFLGECFAPYSQAGDYDGIVGA